MKVTQVSIGPTQSSISQGRATLVPEMLAAVGARYSRSNLGLEAILDKISTQDQEQSIDAIFRFIDFGHASVADMAPVAMFLDGVTMWLAYYVWSLCPTAGGQESSTRYIRLSPDNLPTPEAIGIPTEKRAAWQSAMAGALAAYEGAIEFWEGVAAKTPAVTRIPAALLEDESERAQKQVARMRRNYAFDRARYFLPAALRTNVMLVMSARAWVTLCQQLLSHPLPEPQQLGGMIRAELELAAPRLIKHATAKPDWQGALAQWFDDLVDGAHTYYEVGGLELRPTTASATARLDVFTLENGDDVRQRALEDLRFHSNRYGPVGHTLSTMPVRFSWDGVAFGDIRDLNRHRTGTKYCPLIPRGFYGAADQLPVNSSGALPLELGVELSSRCLHLLAEKDATHVYWTLLGTQFYFQHTTTANHFLYEAELRTGVGAHYRYAKHLHDALELWYEKFPETRGLVLEGSAEPE